MTYHRIIGELKSSVIDEINNNGIFYSTNVKFESEFNYRSIYSIKYQIEGNEYYIINNNQYFLQPAQFIIVNNESDVSLQPTQNSEKAISIFIEPFFLNDVFANYKHNEDSLLSNPLLSLEEEVAFSPKHSIVENNFLSKILRNLAEGFGRGRLNNKCFSSAFFYHISRALLLSKIEIQEHFANLQTVKYSTKIELYQRMIRAKEFIIDNWNKSIKISSIAKCVNMSPYHFHRTFTSTFKITPAQYRTKIRLNKAKELLLTNKYSVSETAMLIGYEDIYSFSKEFKKYFGFPPSALK